MLKLKNHCFRRKLCNKISEKALLRISKKGSKSSKFERFDFASRVGRRLLPPHRVSSWWVPRWEVTSQLLPSSFFLPRGFSDAPISVLGQTPPPWLPSGTKSLALGLVKLSVGISKEHILPLDVLNHFSLESQPDKCPWEQADTKGTQLHSSQISLHRGMLLQVLLVYLNVHLLPSAHPLWTHTSLDGAGGHWCLILST